MQTILGDSFYEMLNPFICVEEEKNISKMWSSESITYHGKP